MKARLRYCLVQISYVSFESTRIFDIFIRFFRFMVFNTTFNNISVISWQFYWWRKQEYPEKRPTCRKSFTNFITYSCIEYMKSKANKKTHKYLVCKPCVRCRLLWASCYMALSHFIRRTGNSWQDLIWPCFLYQAYIIPNTL